MGKLMLPLLDLIDYLLTYIMKLIEWLSGRKTYLVAIATALYILLKSFGLFTVTPEQETAVFGLLAALFGIALRSGVAKSNCT